MIRRIFFACLVLLPLPADMPCCIGMETLHYESGEPEPGLFEEAVVLIKKYEGWHDKKHYPYVGYGHRLLKGETFDYHISEVFADSLLRNDLRQKCSRFRQLGADSLLLGTLAYNVGERNLLGDKKRPPSMLIKKLKRGERDIYCEYLSFCHYKGMIIPSLKRRREEEFQKLFIKTNNQRQ